MLEGSLLDATQASDAPKADNKPFWRLEEPCAGVRFDALTKASRIWCFAQVGRMHLHRKAMVESSGPVRATRSLEITPARSEFK